MLEHEPLWIKQFIAPCVRFMNRFSLRRKFFIIGCVFSIPILILGIFQSGQYYRESFQLRQKAAGISLLKNIHLFLLETNFSKINQSTSKIDNADEKNKNTNKKNEDNIEHELKGLQVQTLQTAWNVFKAKRLSYLQLGGRDQFSEMYLAYTELLNRIRVQFRIANVQDTAANLPIEIVIQHYPNWLLLQSQILNESNEKSSNETYIHSMFVRVNQLIASYGTQEINVFDPKIQTLVSVASKANDVILRDLSDSNLSSKLLSEGTLLALQKIGVNTLNLKVEELFELLEHSMNQEIKRAQVKGTAVLIFVILLLSLSAYLLLGFYRSFRDTLASVSHSAKAVASGDLTQVIHVEGQDELAQTGTQLEAMNANLSSLVAHVRTNACVVTQVGDELAQSIAALTQRTEQQGASLEGTSISIKELSSTVSENARSAKSADNLAANVRMIAEASGESMSKAVNSMQGIHSSAMKVKEIVSLIDGIAFQTEILALNASVEASRAGEHGRGFAVVATEVRDLAHKSADASRQIRRLIDDSVRRVEEGVEQIYDVNITLEEIVTGVRNLAKNVSAISNASEEQNSGLTEIAVAIHQLDELTQRNSEMAVQASSAAQALRSRSMEMTRSVEMFKLRQGTADEAFSMVKAAYNLYKRKTSTAFELITQDPQRLFHQKDLAVYVLDRSGCYLAYAGDAKRVGTSICTAENKSAGKTLDAMFKVARTGSWVEYALYNIETGLMDQKTAFVMRTGTHHVMGCAIIRTIETEEGEPTLPVVETVVADATVVEDAPLIEDQTAEKSSTT